MIVDRTEQDVINARMIRDEKVKAFEALTQEEVSILERGMLTHNTLNRIEAKQAELKRLINNAGYFNIVISNKSWYSTDIVWLNDLQRIVNNNNNLKKGFFVYGDTPIDEDASLSYVNINKIEKLLYDIESIYDEMVSQYRLCGTFKCGE